LTGFDLVLARFASFVIAAVFSVCKTASNKEVEQTLDLGLPALPLPLGLNAFFFAIAFLRDRRSSTIDGSAFFLGICDVFLFFLFVLVLFEGSEAKFEMGAPAEVDLFSSFFF
jgi:hypothetical protein